MVPIRELRPHPANPRVGSVGRIVESLRAHGQYKPLVVQASTGLVLAGNHTLAALRRLGAEEALCALVDVDDEGALRILLADNKASDRSRYDLDRLTSALTALASGGGLEGSLYGEEELARLLRRLDAAGKSPDAKSALEGTEPLWRIRRRNGVLYVACRSSAPGMWDVLVQRLKDAKSKLAADWVEAMAADVAEAAAGLSAAPPESLVVSCPPSRAAAFDGTANFAEAAAAKAAERIGARFERLFEPRAANRRGHHPAREKDPPRLAQGVRPPAALVLVDDLATSGATMELSAKAVRAAGGSALCVVWLVRGD